MSSRFLSLIYNLDLYERYGEFVYGRSGQTGSLSLEYQMKLGISNSLEDIQAEVQSLNNLPASISISPSIAIRMISIRY